MLLPEVPLGDYKGAAVMFEAMPPAPALLADRGYDADWFSDALQAKAIKLCISRRCSQ